MILGGNYNLNMENNIVLFRAFHKYIHFTKRFKTIDYLFEVFLKHILYINKYTCDQICSIPKLKWVPGSSTIFFVFLIIQY